MQYKLVYFKLFLFILCGCEAPVYSPNKNISQILISDSVGNIFNEHDYPVNEIEKRMRASGLVDVLSVDSGIHVELRYSTTQNFLGLDVYGDLSKAYLQPDVAEKLKNAQQHLKKLYPAFNLLVLDAARPVSVQQIMWDTIKKPINEKVKFLSNPKRGSLHNYGAAVDITIIDSAGVELDMGTPYDYEGEEAYPVAESSMLKQGKISQAQINNRELLRKVMYKAGFFNIQTEWWHFNSCYRKQAQEKYKLIF